MSLLAGARIALLEARLANEMAELVRREGGEPVLAPALFEARLDVAAIIPSLIDDIRRARIEVIVCLTGAGVASLFAQAQEVGCLASLTSALSGLTTVCRGPKPAAVLRRHDIPVRVSVQPPHTTSQLLAALAGIPVRGRGVVVLCDGGTNSTVMAALAEREARVHEIRTYEWQLPADIGPIEQLVRELAEDRIDAVAFTTQVQVRHLFAIADRLNERDALLRGLVHQTVVGSIGPACSVVLEELGVVPHVVASPPRMRPLITALGARLAARRTPEEATVHDT